jgi:hypothetical protein
VARRWVDYLGFGDKELIRGYRKAAKQNQESNA